MSRYKIKGMGRGFDGLVVEGTWIAIDDGVERDLFRLSKITNDNVVFGDRNVSFPVPAESLYISEEFLEEIEDDEKREFSHKNPFGKYVKNYTLEKNSSKLVVTEYENALSISVIDPHGMTVYSQNYFLDLPTVQHDIVATFLNEDLEDTIFTLKDFKSDEIKTIDEED
jgi:hypothetical protein